MTDSVNPQVVVIPRQTDDTTPTKVLGEPGQQAKMYVSELPGGRKAMRIILEKGFDWTETIRPILPGCPEWCPATHFGYLESGSMGIKMSDGTTTTVRAGDIYLVEPGHLPIITEDAVMVEFSQDPTYTSKEFINK